MLAGALTLSIVAATGAARAAGPNDAAAEALFVEAKKLAAQRKYAEACPKFAESNRLDRGAGTLIHLGDCYEKNNQTASAWATYKEAASAAQALDRKDWEKLASQRAKALEAKLARITIQVDRANSDRMKTEVTRDGTAVSQASWGVPIPVDIGPHTIEASAAGHVAFKTTVTVVKDGESLEVVVPKLEAEKPETPIATTPAPTTPPRSSAGANASAHDGSSQRTLGFVASGVGLVGLAVGAVTGLMAMSQANEAKATCPDDGPCASKGAVDASDSARSLGLISTLGFAAGAVGVGVGSVLIFAAGSSSNKASGAPAVARVRVSPTGLALTGSF